MENYITLSELQGRIRAVIDQQVGGAQWVVAEISECKVNYAGHCYLELVERQQDGKAPAAQVRAIIWSGSYKMISGYFRFQTGADITSGMKVLVKCTVTYHSVYGLSLVISDIDPAYTLGETERLRRQTIAQLQEEGVFDMNRDFELPEVVQRIAVISSPKAAGYRDFMEELSGSSYRFEVQLFAAVMQGEAAESSIVDALEQVAERGDDFEAVILIRGGGSTSDLGCFDNYRLCAYIAQFPLPVVTGIGHDKDISVADMVAHTSLKTPTAVAAFLVDRAREIHARLDELNNQVTDQVQRTLMMESNRLENTALLLGTRTTGLLHGRMARLDQLRHHLHLVSGELFEQDRRRFASFGTLLSQYSTRLLTAAQAQAAYYSQQLATSSNGLIMRRQAQLELLAVSVDGASPKRILARGYAIVRGVKGNMSSASKAEIGQRLEIEMQDGILTADIISKTINIQK